ncbi:hypothetical protein [Haloarcula salina]|uniref:Lipoprotein n=1 Tax=Haloarcula salina TaxID=1429914 RepID=A0AA41G557_9EURY|nr:hypothetical protein [Haloarcula salina]MBV0903704.1 hypothetical protein [Haloarcula salina]
MPSRRTLLGTVACTLVAGCSGVSDDPSTDATATPAPVVLSLVAAAAVPETATVGIFSETTADIRAAIRDASTDVTDHEWAHMFHEFDCFAFDGVTYEITEGATGSGGYVNEYSVTEVDEPGNESTVRVADLPDSDRRAVIDAIASGEHRYDSDAGGFDPYSSVYVYNGSYYVFSLDSHADKPLVATYVIEEADDNRCVTLEPLSLDDAQVTALDTALQSDGEPTVTGGTARMIAASDVAFLIRDGDCYKLSTPAHGSEV